MSSSKESDRRERREFSAEFKAEAVGLVTEPPSSDGGGDGDSPWREPSHA